MTDASYISIFANVIPLIVATLTWLKLRKTDKRLADKEGRELDIKEAASSLEGWKTLNKFLSEEVSRGNEDRARLWRAQLDCEDTKARLEKKVHELEAINKELVKEVSQLKEQVRQLLTQLKK